MLFLFFEFCDLDTLINNHSLLLESTGQTLERRLAGQIDWTQRLISIKGFRGVGKTTFLLNFIRNNFGHDRSVLYVNLNNFYFTRRRIFSFADEFSKLGGKILFLDQINKYPDWSSELRKCYDEIPDLRIVFTASPVLRVTDENPELQGIVNLYHLEGLSFREYLNYKTGENFNPLTFEDILTDHVKYSQEITDKVKPLAWFSDYLRNGYYPYFMKAGHFYSDILLKNINLALEIDIPYFNQIELKYLPRLRKLLYTIALETPLSPNVSKLASAIGTSRATVMNYLNYLKNAKLIRLLYGNGDEDMAKKPVKVFLHNTNILHTMIPERADNNNMRQTFFLNQTGISNKVQFSAEADFLVNEKYHFTVGGRKSEAAPGQYCAADMIETGEGNKIPLWLFGFLY
jgi:predicted AAA+ superfamily ATPase